MYGEMSTRFLLTLISDHLKGLEELVGKLKERDSGCKEWEDLTMNTFTHTLTWLKDKVNSRLEQSGINPDSLSA